MERRTGGFISEMGYRETDKRQIKEANMRYLSPQQSADLFKVLAKINIDKKPIGSLSKQELYTLFYGHIFTNTLGPSGIRLMDEGEMNLYAEIMSDSLSRKYEDVEVYLYQFPRSLSPEEAKEFTKKVEHFHKVMEKFEHTIGKRDRI